MHALLLGYFPRPHRYLETKQVGHIFIWTYFIKYDEETAPEINDIIQDTTCVPGDFFSTSIFQISFKKPSTKSKLFYWFIMDMVEN